MDRGAATAVLELSKKLESNKLVNSSNLTCIADPMPDSDTLLDSDLFSDTSTKRPFSEADYTPLKRLRLDLTTAKGLSDIEMGRKSNGHSHYEFKNSKVDVEATTTVVKQRLETLMSTPGFMLKTPSSFAKSASLARIRTLERSVVFPFFDRGDMSDPNLFNNNAYADSC